jgi:hypothetical protein
MFLISFGAKEFCMGVGCLPARSRFGEAGAPVLLALPSVYPHPQVSVKKGNNLKFYKIKTHYSLLFVINEACGWG